MADADGIAAMMGGAAPGPGEGLYRSLFHLSPEGRSLTRVSDGHYIDINTALLKMLGYSREDVMGRAPLELGIWHFTAERDALVKLLVEQGAATGFKATLQRRDGSTFGALVSAALLELEGERYFLSSVVAA
jgi:PAS domain S-box-containing protein